MVECVAWLSRSVRRVLRWTASGSPGNVTVVMAMAMAPLIAAFGLATETSSWFMIQRSMQHAADSAAMAAAIGHVATDDQDYAEARAVAASYGYVDGANDVTVTPLRGQTCPVPNQAYADCYKVTITKTVPINLVRLVGYQGDVAIGTGRGKSVTTVSMARPNSGSTDLCFMGLATTGDSLRVNGGGNSINWNGCSVFGNSDLTCNGAGSDNNMSYGISAGTSICGVPGNTPVLSDPYSYLAALIPADTCGGAYNGGTLSGENTSTWPTIKHLCGNYTLGGPLVINNPDQILVIHQGNLALDGNTLSTASGGGLTLIFEGPPGSTARRVTGLGTLNYAAPETGTLHGVALIQDPDMAASSFDFAGNDPNYYVTGLAYMPNADIRISGTIHFQVGGNDCFALVASRFRADGNITVIEGPNTQCAEAGVATPSVPGVGARAALVQ